MAFCNNTVENKETMYISAIPIFIAVVENKSFSRAAEKLGITKSAVSKRITQLEQHLGVKLLSRSTRQLSLTEAGERYLEHARKALDATIEAEDAATELQTQPKGTLNINVPMSFGRLHIAPLIPLFLNKYPDISLKMDMSDVWSDIVAEGYDIAIRAADLKDSSLFARKIAPLKSVLCASPNYIEKYSTPKEPHELLGHNCILYSYSQIINEWQFTKNNEIETIRVKGNYQVNNSEALNTALIQGAGVGRLPSFVAGEGIKNGTLIPLLTDYEMAEKIIYAVFAEKTFMPQKIRVFIDFLISHIGGDTPYWDEWRNNI